MNTEADNKIELSTPIQYVKGVGPARAKSFAKLGLTVVGDILEYFPRSWSFMPEPVKIADLHPNETATIAGILEETNFQQYRRPPMFKAVIADETGFCDITWFNARYLARQLEPGQIVVISGKPTLYKHKLQFSNPKFMILDDDTELENSDLAGAVYPATAKLSSRQIKSVIKPIVESIAASVPEIYTADFLKKNVLIDRGKAYLQIHTPADEEQLANAKRRLKYDELFLMQLGLAVKRHQTRHTTPAVAMRLDENVDSRIRRRFPFMLTGDQDAVIEEIAADMKSTVPMNRLLQGDVGSGKTVVALYAALLAIANKTQAAIMAPTEILATQHLQSIEKFLKGSQVKSAMITGKIPQKQKKEIIAQIKSGEINLVVGTVALLNEQIEFDDLGVVIIDEQHKFGVGQRAKIRKSHAPHSLVMTATPIPRTLAMTVFGDLDVSTIRHLPPGRGKVTTRWVKPHDREVAYDFIRQRLRAKKQAYFVYPRIENEDETSDVKAAVQEYHILKEHVFPEFKVELLHGQMSSEQKAATMDNFRKGITDCLVSTVVIEVGVDVANATMMIIENANRFGMAQLHQLRGRIGRGESNSYCLLFAETEDETAVSRLEMMTKTNDGFEIAEHDLKLRGPGELFSTRQHGLPDLKIANIVDDFELLNLARKDAFEMAKSDPLLKSPANSEIRTALIKKFGDKIGLVDIA